MNWLVVAAGFARMVVGPGSDPPDMQPDDAILFVRANSCVPGGGIPDAASDGGGSGSGIVLDAGVTPLDAPGPTAPPPEAAIPDAGPPDDAGIPDAGPSTCSDSVMMVVQPRFTLSSRGSTFALLYVTPAPPVMRLELPTTFDDLAAATAPYIDTQIVEVPDPALGTRCEGCISAGGGGGGGCGFAPDNNPGWNPPSLDGGVGGPTIQTLGPYDVATRQPTSRTELAKWLDDLGYTYSDLDLTALEPYIARGWSVVAVRISQHGSFNGGLQPLSMTWAGSDIVVPLSLASQPALTVYISANHEYVVPNAYLSYSDYSGSSFSFITRNEVTDLSYDRTAEQAPIDSYVHDVQVVYQEEHVPVSKNCDDQGCCQSGPGTTNGVLWGSALLLVMRRKRRR